jgi:ATP-dependent DNA helicase RecG
MRKFGHMSVARNPVTFDMFNRLDMVEKAGSGIGRIKVAIKERELKVKFDLTSHFNVTFIRATDIPLGILDGAPGYSDRLQLLKSSMTANEMEILRMCLRTSRSSRVIAKELGHASLSNSDKRSLRKLIKEQLLAYTISGKPSVKGQKYVASDLARKLLGEK